MSTRSAIQSRSMSNGEPHIDATYEYLDERNDPLFQVVRFIPKKFRIRKLNDMDRWECCEEASRGIPYRLPELLESETETVFVVEGEKDVDSLYSIGLVATCNAGGVGKWTHEYSEFLVRRNVIVIPDNDEDGQLHAEQVARSLQGLVNSLKVLPLPDIPPGGDVSDWLANGTAKEDLLWLANIALEWSDPDLWSEIQSYDEVKLPCFPTHALPQVFQEWVKAESKATQTPADLAGILCLAGCAAAIAGRVEVEAREGWIEPVNIFVAALLESGNRKSSVFRHAMLPIKELERELTENTQEEIAKEQSILRQDEMRLKKLEKIAAEKNDEKSKKDAVDLAADLAKRSNPVAPRLIVEDATTEKLEIMLAEQNGRMASMSAEGRVFELMSGSYSKNGMPQFNVYLKGHAGDDLVTDRVSRESVRVDHPALTCAYTIQPEVISGLAHKNAFRGRGLLARFLFVVPESWLGEREIATPPVPEIIKNSYCQTVMEMGRMEGKHVLMLDHEASQRLISWESQIETMLGDGGEMECFRDWGGKLAGATVRLAAVLHCMEYTPVQPICVGTIDSAVEIARYLIPHAEAVLKLIQQDGISIDDDAQYVLRWIKRHTRSDFTKREAHQHGKRRFPRAEDIDPALNELVDRGYIRQLQDNNVKPGRPRSPRYEVNPELTARFQPDVNEDIPF